MDRGATWRSRKAYRYASWTYTTFHGPKPSRSGAGAARASGRERGRLRFSQGTSLGEGKKNKVARAAYAGHGRLFSHLGCAPFNRFWSGRADFLPENVPFEAKKWSQRKTDPRRAQKNAKKTCPFCQKTCPLVEKSALSFPNLVKKTSTTFGCSKKISLSCPLEK